MEWFQVITIIGSVLGAVFYIHSDNKEWRIMMREDMKSYENKTQKLYEMFIELLKHKNTP